MTDIKQLRIRADEFIATVRNRLLIAFPEQIKSIYLLGSRVTASEIETSDIDLVVIFKQSIGPNQLTELHKFVHAAQEICPIAFDLTALDESEIKSGITPHLCHGKLLAGPDIVRDCPLKPVAELILYHAGHAIHFIRRIRGAPKAIRFPLDYPSPSGEYYGYEINGIRMAEGKYVPGLNIFINLITSIATFRLASLANVFTPSKCVTVTRYRDVLPDDPWTAMIEGTYDMCRNRLRGFLPTDKNMQAQLIQWCQDALKFENDFLSSLILRLDHWLPLKNPSLKRHAFDFVNSVETSSEEHASKLDDLKKRLRE